MRTYYVQKHSVSRFVQGGAEALAEFERALTQERTRTGLDGAESSQLAKSTMSGHIPTQARNPCR